MVVAAKLHRVLAHGQSLRLPSRVTRRIHVAKVRANTFFILCTTASQQLCPEASYVPSYVVSSMHCDHRLCGQTDGLVWLDRRRAELQQPTTNPRFVFP